MSQMLAEISRIVNEDISNRVNQYDVLFESITNSIHANATSIKCYLNCNNMVADDGEESIGTIKVDTIKIVDNGDGLTDDNYKSFSKYRTKFKKDLGCKGVGRFVFLKVYKNAKYTSKISSIQEERKINFDFQFDTDNFKKHETEVLENETEVSLQFLNKNYLDYEKKVDRRIQLDLHKIRGKVLIHLIPTLFFYKQKGVEINIDFIDEYNELSIKIAPEDVPAFLEKKFQIRNSDGITHDFLLHYKIENIAGSLNAFYCANNRAVCEFSEKDLKISMPYNYSGYMLLESKYFDTKVNNDRNNFDIFPVKTDVFSPLSWELINSEVKKNIGDIVKEGVPETKKINKQKLKEIQEERPYLIQHIQPEDIEMAGFLDKRNIIEKAKKSFDTAKERVLSNSGKEEYTDKELNDAIALAQNELVSYINDRVIVIDRLKTLVDKSERVESIIHNLFMKQYTKDDYYSVGKNNLWLLDDRFTTYSYAASDKRIGEVLNDIGENTDDVDILGDKPDLSLFFSHKPNNVDRLKSVLVEIKPFDFSKKPDRKKFQGIQQLLDYVKAFKDKEKIEEVYGYLITDIDKELSERLLDDSYTPMFSTERPIYHRFYERLGISIYVVSAKTLIYDAESRNRIFLNIIKKQNKITNLLK
ncbi:ATP-binding protein [uncultured Polaribacter sp.]|uniref:ATP-binding protein n=1 Tax=uncultured Polaribacter sp. TaxID=174711 RepID=UPI002637BD9A|nr:ATP-binding protein [uncultured Polaribacter sp.]